MSETSTVRVRGSQKSHTRTPTSSSALVYSHLLSCQSMMLTGQANLSDSCVRQLCDSRSKGRPVASSIFEETQTISRTTSQKRRLCILSRRRPDSAVQHLEGLLEARHAAERLFAGQRHAVSWQCPYLVVENQRSQHRCASRRLDCFVDQHGTVVPGTAVCRPLRSRQLRSVAACESVNVRQQALKLRAAAGSGRDANRTSPPEAAQQPPARAGAGRHCLGWRWRHQYQLGAPAQNDATTMQKVMRAALYSFRTTLKLSLRGTMLTSFRCVIR